MTEKIQQGLGCGLDVTGCGSDMDNKADRSLSHSILRGRLGSEIDVMEGDSIVYGRKLSSQQFGILKSA